MGSSINRDQVLELFCEIENRTGLASEELLHLTDKEFVEFGVDKIMGEYGLSSADIEPLIFVFGSGYEEFEADELEEFEAEELEDDELEDDELEGEELEDDELEDDELEGEELEDDELAYGVHQ